MPYCSKCGVEVDNFVEKCPLCGTPIQKFENLTQLPEKNYPEEHINISYNEENRKSFWLNWTIFTILIFTPFFIILTIAYQINSLTTWAGYPLSSLIFIWLIVNTVIFLKNRKLTMSILILIITSIFIFIIDLIDGKITWYFQLGLPIILLFSLLSIITLIYSIKTKYKGFNIIGIILFLSGIFCIGLDIIITLFIKKPIKLSWSLIVISGLFPLSLLFIFLHYIFKKKVILKRFFHL